MRSLSIQRDVSLIDFSTFRLPAMTREMVILEHTDQIQAALDTALPVLILGGGSNTVFVGDFPGRIIVNRLKGIEAESIDAHTVQVTAAAGEDWHELVLWSLQQNLWGLENLALIPGSVGAAPIQNIGAYGVELADCLEAVQVFDRNTAQTYWLDASECDLSYRESRFKSTDAGRFIILAVRLLLSKKSQLKLGYPALQNELKQLGIITPERPDVIANAVIRIRQSKLPDPQQIPNAGSFFKNPIVAKAQTAELLKQHPELPHWPAGEGIKLSAGWMIDQLGWRGMCIRDAQVYPKHALVLTNRGQATGEDLLTLARKIKLHVRVHYGIGLKYEPQILGDKL